MIRIVGVRWQYLKSDVLGLHWSYCDAGTLVEGALGVFSGPARLGSA